MPDLDLYKIHGLDRSAPSQALAAQLTAQLNAAPDPLARQRIDTARAILGDPARRGRYDAQLADPQAPAITEQTLAALAGRPVPSQPSGLSAAFSQPNVRLVAIAAAVLGLVLIIVISAVSCGGGNDRIGPATTVGADGSTTETTVTTGESKPLTNYDRTLEFADWYRGAPKAKLVITEAYDLPADFKPLIDPAWVSEIGPSPVELRQYQDKSIGVRSYRKQDRPTACCEPNQDRGPEAAYARITPDGKVVETGNADRQRPSFDLARSYHNGYYYVEVPAGITLPAAAAGTKPNQHYITVVGDAFDDTLFWIVPRGGTQIYKAHLYKK